MDGAVPSRTETFGDLLRRYRLDAGLTQEALAERSGLSVRGISDLERGARTRPQRETLRLLADGLGLVGDGRLKFLQVDRRPAPDPIRNSLGFAARLPVPQDEFVGRETEITVLQGLLGEASTRLVTLTGPGGSGKTRLALETAAGLQDAYPGGVWFLDLAALTDPDLLLPHIAAGVGVRERGWQPLLSQLASAFSDGRSLLILDNLEQFRPYAAMSRRVAGLLAAVPGLTVLATSRAPLRLRLERELVVSPLPVPAPDDSSLDRLLASPSVRLFIVRAQSARPGFSPSAFNAEPVAALCRRLDGVPLAIELAAARARALSPADLMTRLGDGLNLLSDRGHERPDRQKTLESAIAWSVDLLTAEDQAVFRRLAVFAGGFTLEAAEAVLAAAPPATADGLGSLEVLVEQGLVLAEEQPGGTLRYRLLETVRAFAAARLRERSEDDAACKAHAAYFAALGFEAERRMRLTPLAYLAQLGPEVANLRAAFEWAEADGQAENELWLALAFGAITYMQGRVAEARQWVERAVARPDSSLAVLRARALVQAGWLALYQGELEVAERAARAVITLADGEPMVRADGLNLLGCVAMDHGHEAEAARFFEDALATIDGLADAGELLPFIHNNLGVLASVRGDLRAARAQYEAALAALPGGAHLLRSTLFGNLGKIDKDEGNYRLAAQWFGEAFAAHHELGYPGDAADWLEAAAQIAATMGIVDASARLLGAAAVLRDSVDGVIEPQNLAAHECAVAQTRERLGEARFAASWAQGQRLTKEEAIAAAEAVFASVSESSSWGNGVVR
jgi:predicted ATPase/transcriptional regulator with XRE-family HTH domain